MDAIKKKMQSLKAETDNSLARAEQLDSEAQEANRRAEKTEEHVRDLQKKMQHVENDLDITIEKLSSTTTKLDEKDKAFQVSLIVYSSGSYRGSGMLASQFRAMRKIKFSICFC